MLSVRVDDDVYGLDDPSSVELVRRLEDASPVPDSEDGVETTLEKVRGALDADDPVELDDGDLALLGVVVEAWAVEAEGDLPGDVEELREAIADEIG
jgi:hypothetical protein